MSKSRTPSNRTGDYRPIISNAGQPPTIVTRAIDEQQQLHEIRIAEERPLTIFVDNRQIVTLMTLGAHPELLTLGYLRNQGLAENLKTIASVRVDWNRDKAEVRTVDGRGVIDVESQQQIINPSRSVSMQKLRIRQTQIYTLLKNVSTTNEVYRVAGAVHGCAVCYESEILCFVEDIGRHNATDTIAGQMWLTGVSGADKCLYSTGRLTSEIVIKAARMDIPVLLSRSGITNLGLELAKDLNITLIARAKGRHFLVYHGHETLLYDAVAEANKKRNK